MFDSSGREDKFGGVRTLGFVMGRLTLPLAGGGRLECLAMRMDRSTTFANWVPQSLAVWLMVFSVTLSFARQASDEAPPEVEQLYAQAKAAQQQGDRATAIEKYRAMITLAPHLAAAYNNLGMLYFKDGDYDHAVEVLQSGLAIDPNLHTASAMLGMSYFQLGVYKKAEPLLRAALSTNPNDDNVEMMLALLLIDLKQFSEAALHLNNFLERNPKSQEGWYLLRKAYVQMSEDAMAKINEIDPDSFITHEIAGEMDESAYKYARAFVEYKKAIDMAPHRPGTHMHLANVYWHTGRWESAQAEFKAELANDPNNCTAYWKLGDAMIEARNSYEDAISELNQSIERCPTLMEARVDRARTLIRLGKQSDALPDLLVAEKNSPAEPVVHYHLAAVYRAQGKTAEAQQEMLTFAQLKKEANEAAARQANNAGVSP
jgi:tetratricopeptide (TPR) repeat protein